MKKIILTLGLSIAFTLSPALAKNLIDQSPFKFTDTRTIYLKPFLGYGNHLPKMIGIHAVCSSKLNYRRNSDANVADITSIFPIELPEKIIKSYPRAGGLIDSKLQMKETLKTQFNINQMLFAGVDIGGYVNDYFSIVNEIGYHYLHDTSFHYNIKGEMSGTQVMSIDENVNRGSIGIINCMLKPVINIVHSQNFSFYVTGGIGVSYTMLHGDNMNLSFTGECDTDKIMSIVGAPSAVSKTISTNIQRQFTNLVDYFLEEKQNLAKTNRRYNISSTAFQMSWMLGAGLTIDINYGTKLDIGYSYKSLCYIQAPFLYRIMVKESIKDAYINCHYMHFGVRAYF